MNTMTTPEPLLLSGREAAKMLSISQSQLAKMRYRGEVAGIILGKNCVRYAIEDLQALIVRARGSRTHSQPAA